nr:gamma-aminobutyric acid receptor alpha-like [Onthophagus taurus]
MNLEDFPMDIQRCPLRFGSFGYTTRDVIYKWNRARQIVTAEDMKLSQFDLIGTPTANYTDAITGGDTLSDVTTNNTEFSMLLVSFHLQRHMGNFLIQVYGPCVLLVVLSWVSFWLNREATADRVSLGITTVLTMTFLGLEARTDLPKVPYPTALDYFVFVSFTFIFATIIQFAVVHYFTKYGSGECYFNAEMLFDSSSEEEDCNSEICKCISTSATTSEVGQNDFLIEVIPLTPCTLPSKSGNRMNRNWHCWMNSSKETNVSSISKPMTQKAPSTSHREHCKRKKKKATPRFNSVSKIDKFSRIVFPMLFLAINIFYWYSYLSRTKRVR